MRAGLISPRARPISPNPTLPSGLPIGFSFSNAAARFLYRSDFAVTVVTLSDLTVRQRSSQRSVIPDREIDPFRRRPVRVLGADDRGQFRDDLVRPVARFAPLAHAPGKVDHVVAHRREDTHVA